MIIKAISLYQPWASLWAAGIKIHETRGRPTTHRGLLAVHAAKHKDADAALLYDDLCSNPEYSDHIMAAELPSEFANLPFGAIVGLVELEACLPTEQIRQPHNFRLEYMLGNFSAGRFAWRAEDARLFKKPIPWKGKQGFFNVEIPDAWG